MKRTVDEKYKYNKQQVRNPFSTGYVLGVKLYRDYPKGDSELKEISRDIVTNAKSGARLGDIFSKGIMCGVRDAANERKERQKR